MTTLEVLDVGTVANDRTGDTWLAAMIKVNTNTATLQAFIDAEAFVKISVESDFPTQTASTITLEALTVYVIAGAFTTTKNFLVEDGAAWTSFNQSGPLVTYSGSGDMFSGTNVQFIITDCAINCPSAQAFAFTDTVVNTKVFKFQNTTLVSCAKIGTITGMANGLFLDGNVQSAADGITYAGTVIAATMDRMFLGSTSASFIGIDLGTAVIQNPEFTNLIVVAPSGAIGISGATASANVPTGFIGMVANSSFSGGMTSPISGIAVTDFRWTFSDNTPIPDTVADFLLSFNGSTTETTIGVGSGDDGNPIVVNATWTCVRQSLFSCTAGGKATSLSERDIAGFPIDTVLGLISAGGGAIKVTVYIAKDGSVIADSATSINISGSNQALVPIPWQDTVEKDSEYEVYIENNTNTVNIIVESGKLRGR